MKIKVPVKCHNGHKAEAYFVIAGLESTYLGVPKEMDCECPKWNYGEGWSPDGDPEVISDA